MDGGDPPAGDDPPGDEPEPGAPCPDPEECVLQVLDAAAICGPELEPPPPGGALINTPELNTISVLDLDHSQGCCPERTDVTATVMSDGASIELEYSIMDDFCDCICGLDVSYLITDVPPGTWTLLLPGGSEIDVDVL